MGNTDIYFRDIELKDLESYKKLTHPKMLYHEFNGPYFERETEQEFNESIKILSNKLENREKALQQIKLIIDKNSEEIIGQVNWYWKSKETDWLEIGIIIFNEKYWGIGLGNIALTKWIDEIFIMFPQIIRVGLTTWSGNKRMMKLAEKIGLKLEARYINARKYKDEFYDSVSYGILKEEWKEIIK